MSPDRISAFEGQWLTLYWQFHKSPMGSVFYLVSFYLQIAGTADTSPSSQKGMIKKEQTLVRRTGKS